MMEWHSAYIALGSNVGDRKLFLVQAVDALMHTPGIRIGELSRIRQTDAVAMAGGTEPFLNAVVSIQTTLDPFALLARLREVEHNLGRPDRGRQNTDRTIDLDLLMFDDRVIDEPELSLPHPRMHERAFVLDPLLDVAPEDLTVPGPGAAGRTLRVLRDALNDRFPPESKAT